MTSIQRPSPKPQYNKGGVNEHVCLVPLDWVHALRKLVLLGNGEVDGIASQCGASSFMIEVAEDV